MSAEARANAVCPECGALCADGLDCWGRLGCLLAWEAQDTELAAAHFLTVAAYNVQHPAQFTSAAVADLSAALVDHLDNGLSVAEIRRRMALAFAGGRRVLKPAQERLTVMRPWRMTIADVYANGHASGAAGRVRRWATVIRDDLPPSTPIV